MICSKSPITVMRTVFFVSFCEYGCTIFKVTLVKSPIFFKAFTALKYSSFKIICFVKSALISSVALAFINFKISSFCKVASLETYNLASTALIIGTPISSIVTV